MSERRTTIGGHLRALVRLFSRPLKVDDLQYLNVLLQAAISDVERAGTKNSEGRSRLEVLDLLRGCAEMFLETIRRLDELRRGQKEIEKPTCRNRRQKKIKKLTGPEKKAALSSLDLELERELCELSRILSASVLPLLTASGTSWAKEISLSRPLPVAKPTYRKFWNALVDGDGESSQKKLSQAAEISPTAIKPARNFYAEKDMLDIEYDLSGRAVRMTITQEWRGKRYPEQN